MVLQGSKLSDCKVSISFLRPDLQSSYSFGRIQNVGETELSKEKSLVFHWRKISYLVYIYINIYIYMYIWRYIYIYTYIYKIGHMFSIYNKVTRGSLISFFFFSFLSSSYFYSCLAISFFFNFICHLLTIYLSLTIILLLVLLLFYYHCYDYYYYNCFFD